MTFARGGARSLQGGFFTTKALKYQKGDNVGNYVSYGQSK